MKVRVVAMRPGFHADAWDLTVGKVYEALVPRGYPDHDGDGADFDYVDDVGARVWAKLDDDPVVIWEVVEQGEYKGFVINRDGGPDAPWRGWHPDGTKYRADTYSGLIDLIDADRVE